MARLQSAGSAHGGSETWLVEQSQGSSAPLPRQRPGELEALELAQQLVRPDVAARAMAPRAALGTHHLIGAGSGSWETEAQDPMTRCHCCMAPTNPEFPVPHFAGRAVPPAGGCWVQGWVL